MDKIAVTLMQIVRVLFVGSPVIHVGWRLRIGLPGEFCIQNKVMKCSLIFSLMTLTKASGTQSKVITTFRWHVNLNWISYVTYYYFQSYISQLYKWSSPGGYSWEFLVGLCRPVLQILTLFQTEKLSFSTTVFRPGVDRNCVIIT